MLESYLVVKSVVVSERTLVVWLDSTSELKLEKRCDSLLVEQMGVKKDGWSA